MFNSLQKKFLDKCIAFIKDAPEDVKEKIGKKKEKSVLKKLEKLYFTIEYIEKLIVVVYGLDSQILLDFKDRLNKYSIDQDREDTK